MELANKKTIELKWRTFITPLKFVRFSRLFRVQSTVHCANQEKSSLLQTSNFPAHFPRKCGRNAAFRRSSAGYSITGRAHWPTLSPPYSLLIPRRQFLTTVVFARAAVASAAAGPTACHSFSDPTTPPITATSSTTATSSGNAPLRSLTFPPTLIGPKLRCS